MKKLMTILIACTIVEALQSLRPGAQWNVRGSSVEWLDSSQTQPTNAQIASAISTCQTNLATRTALKAQARIDVKNTTLTIVQRLQALLILQDLDQ